MYLGSADWMPRNLYERVEVMFRLKDPALCQQVYGTILAPYLVDTAKTRILQADGTYARAFNLPGRSSRSRNGTRFSVQDYFMKLAEGGESFDKNSLQAHAGDRFSAQALEFLFAEAGEPNEASQRNSEDESTQ